ncbi:HmuY family protein [Melioribacter sp. OK-6-Me]|uniref:HmuY family protein n=1 Tax=unclassified Melioribacter TaxID=2627329 RepID=UPI003ED93729
MKRIYLFVLLITLYFTGCDDSNSTEPDSNTPAIKVAEVKDLPALGPGLTYYRFADSTIITGADTLSDKWDIAFRSTTIYTNSGVSGPGKGGAIVLKNTDFYDLKEAPSEGYRVDEVNAPAIPTGSGNGWYNYNSETHIISPIPGVVLVIKTGEGKYAKVQIISYYKGAPDSPSLNDKSKYYTFRYVYQSNGTTKFE